MFESSIYNNLQLVTGQLTMQQLHILH